MDNRGRESIFKRVFNAVGDAISDIRTAPSDDENNKLIPSNNSRGVNRNPSRGPDPNYFNDDYFNGNDLNNVSDANGNDLNNVSDANGNDLDDNFDDTPSLEDVNEYLRQEGKPPIKEVKPPMSGQSLAEAIGSMTPPANASEQGLHGGTGVPPSAKPPTPEPQVEPAKVAQPPAKAPADTSAAPAAAQPASPPEPQDDKDKTLVQRVKEEIANSQSGEATVKYDGTIFGGYFGESSFIYKGMDVVFIGENDEYLTFSEFFKQNFGKPIEDLKKLPHEVIYVIPLTNGEKISKPVEDASLSHAIMRDFWRKAEEPIKLIYIDYGINPVNAIDTQKIVDDVQVTDTSDETKFVPPEEISQGKETTETAPAADAPANLADSAIAGAEPAPQSSVTIEPPPEEAPKKAPKRKGGIPGGRKK